MLKHIQNLDAVLTDLKKADIIIAKAKSQFCCFSIKIMGHIYDFERCLLNILKVLKNFDRPECVDVTTA